MDFNRDDFKFRNTESDFRMKGFSNSDNYCFDDDFEERECVSELATQTVKCYQYGRKWSLEQYPRKPLMQGKKKANLSESLVGTSQDKVEPEEADIKYSSEINFNKYTTPLYDRECPGVMTCPMLNKRKSIKNALGK